MVKKAEESNVLRSKNGTTITPQLHAYFSKKDDGHHVLIRVTVLASKKHAYLDTAIYALPKNFDVKTKGLKKQDQQQELRRLLAEALTTVELLSPDDLTPDAIKAAWVEAKRGDAQHDWLNTVASQAEEGTLDTLILKRRQLEEELIDINAMIQQLSVATERAVTKAAPTTKEKSDFEAAKKLFLASLAGRSERDQDAFKSFFTVLRECSVSKGFELSLQVFDMEFYAAYASYILYDRDNFNNTLGAHVKKLKAFLKYSESKGFDVNKGYKDREFKILEETKKVVYLTDDELDMLWSLREVYPQHKQHIDLCVFQNLSGLRVGDCMQKHYIIEDDGDRFLSSTTQKTEGTYCIPLSLDDRIEEILISRDFNMDILSQPVYNRGIKLVLKKMYKHFGRPDVKIEYKRYKLKREVKCEELKSDMISSHSARRGFISRHINGGHFTESDLLSMLGSKDYKQLQKYIQIEAKSLSSKGETSKLSRAQRQQAPDTVQS